MMAETARYHNQADYDRSLGLPEDLQGAVTMEAQLKRFEGLVEQGVPPDEAMQTFGLIPSDFDEINTSNQNEGEV